MGLTGFTAAAAKVVLGIESEGFSAGLRSAETQFSAATGQMGTRLTELQALQLRATTAQDRYTRAVSRFGPASLEARNALLGLARAQRDVAVTQDATLASAGRFERGVAAAGLSSMGMGRALAFASTAFLGGAGFVFALRSAVGAATAFQGSMQQVHTQAGATEVEVRNMSKALLAMAPAVGTTPQELAMGLYHVESAGYRASTALKILRVSAEGAKVGHADLESVTNALVAAEKSGITGVQNMGQAMGALNAIVGAGNMRFADLAEAMSTGVLPSARAFGLSLKDVGSALAVLTDAGVPAQVAATRLSMSIKLLGAQTPIAAKQLATIGIGANQLGETLQHKGLVAALSMLSSHLKSAGLDAAEQADVITRSFGGGRMSSTIITLIQQLDNLRLKEQMIGAGAHNFGEDWARETQTAEFAFARFHASIAAVETGIGNALIPAFTKAGNGVAEWLSKTQNQERMQRDLNNAVHDGAAVLQVFGDGLHQLGEVLHVTDAALGGTGQTLKLLLELLAAKEVIKFGRAIEVSMLPQLRGMVAGAQQGTAYLLGLTKAQTDLAAEQSGRFVPSTVAATAAIKAQTGAVAELTAAIGAQNGAAANSLTNSVGRVSKANTAATATTKILTDAEAQQAITAAQAARVQGMVIGPTGYGGLALRSGMTGQFASVRPAIRSYTTGETVLATGASSAALAMGSAGLVGVLGRAATLLASHAVGAGLIAGLLGPQVKRIPGLNNAAGSDLGKLLEYGGFGLAAGKFLGNPYAGAAVGLGYAAHKIIPGTAGSIIGNVTEGAGVGAVAGSVIPGIGTGIGAAIGGGVGLVASLISLSHATDTATAALKVLGHQSVNLSFGVTRSRNAVSYLRASVANQRVTEDEAKSFLATAAAEEKATRGTASHQNALDNLRAAQQNYDAAVKQLQQDIGSLGSANVTLKNRLNEEANTNEKIRRQFIAISDAADKAKGHIMAMGRGGAIAWETPAQKLQDYIDKMNSLSSSLEASDPKLAAVASALANIAAQTNSIPSKKTIDIVLKVGYDPQALAAAESAWQSFTSTVGAFPGSTGLFPGSIRPNAGPQAHYNSKTGLWVDASGKPVANQQAANQEFLALHPGAGAPKPWQNAHVPLPPAPPAPKTHTAAAPVPIPTKSQLDATIRASLEQQLTAAYASYAKAKTTAQRATIAQTIESLRADLAGTKGPLKKTAVSATLKKIFAGHTGILDAVYKADQTGSKKKEAAALEREAAYLEHYAKAHKGTPLGVAADKALATVDREIRTATGQGRSGTGLGLTGSSLAKWLGLQSGVQIALRHPGNIPGEIKAYRAEQKFLQHYLLSHAADTKQGYQANKLLTSIDKTLLKLVKQQYTLLHKLEQTFLNEQASFFSTFASNDFQDTSAGRIPGSGATAEIHIHQDMRDTATADRHREARLAVNAAKSAMGSIL